MKVQNEPVITPHHSANQEVNVADDGKLLLINKKKLLIITMTTYVFIDFSIFTEEIK